jgi:hypothetical protein
MIEAMAIGKFIGGKFIGGKFIGGKFIGGKFIGGKFIGGEFIETGWVSLRVKLKLKLHDTQYLINDLGS